MRKDSVSPFFELIRAGLFPVHGEGFKVNDSLFRDVEWEEIYKLAQEQSVLGLVLAGLEHSDVKPPKVLLLQWIGEVQLIEQRNKEMNQFIAELVESMREMGIYTLLVKGQGIAQCYEKPLWRSSGDVDLYMSNDIFQKSRKFFRPLVESDEIDDDYTNSINMHYGEWVVEIHTSQHINLSSKIDKVLDTIHKDLFYRGDIRSSIICGTQVFLPSADNDVIIVFTHFLKHYYKGGLGLRQICDWCRLLYTNRESLNYELLEQRIKRAGLMSEWKAFGMFAVEYLGMPAQTMPLLDGRCVIDSRLKRKADRINDFILEVGNFGHNRDTSYYRKYPFLIRKAISFGRRLKDFFRHARVFPIDSIRFLFGMTLSSFKAVSHGE